MQTVLYLQLNIFSLIILAIMLHGSRHDRTMREDRSIFLFNLIIIATMLAIIFDSTMWVLDGRQFYNAHNLYILVTILYFLFNPVCPKPGMVVLCRLQDVQ